MSDTSYHIEENEEDDQVQQTIPQQVQPKKATLNVVECDEYQESNVLFEGAVSKTVKDSNPQISYSEIPMKYNYGTPEAPLLDSTYIQCPELEAPEGIRGSMSKDGVELFSIFCKLPDVVRDIINSIYFLAVDAIDRNKNAINKPDFQKNAASMIFKHPIYVTKDKNTQRLIQGAPSRIYFKILSGSGRKTDFTGLNGEPIDQELLKNVCFKFRPLLSFTKIYVGTTMSLQFKVVSAVIGDISESIFANHNQRIISGIVGTDRAKVAEQSEQIAKLKARQQANKIQSKQEPRQEQSTSSQQQNFQQQQPTLEAYRAPQGQQSYPQNYAPVQAYAQPQNYPPAQQYPPQQQQPYNNFQQQPQVPVNNFGSLVGSIPRRQ